MTVTTFNVHFGGFGPKGRCRYDLASASAALPGSVRVFQEVWDHPDEPSQLRVPEGWAVLEHTFATMARPHRFRLPPPERDRSGRWSLVVATEHPVLDVHTIRLPGVLGDPRRAVLALRLDTPLGELSVVAVHLSSRAVPVGPAVQLAALARQLPAGPTVVVGDHNLWARASAPLLPGFRLAARGATYPAPAARHQIDHIWVRDVGVADGRVLADLGSDHLPVTAGVC